MKYYLPFWLAATAMALMLLGSIFFSGRFIVLSDPPVIAHLSAVKIPPELGDMVGVLDEYGVHLQRRRSRVEIALTNAQRLSGAQLEPSSYGNMTEPMIGYSIREWGFLGMPFGWKREYGTVLYVKNDWGMLYSELKPGAWDVINKANGRDVTRDGFFPFWNHIWGWLFILGLIGAWWLWQRGNDRRREDLGLID